jgi:nucleobase:cation symporter-1, NCS1 family
MLIESRSIDYVPLAERHGKVWHLWPVWFTGDAHLATVAIGMIGIVTGLSLFWTSLAVIAGCAIGTFFMAFHSTQGPQLGLPQMIQSRPQFGRKGALLVWFVALATYVGYNSINLLLAGQTLHQIFGASPRVAFVGFAVMAAALAAIGHDLIHRAQRGIACLMIATLFIFTLGVVFRRLLTIQATTLGDFKAAPFLGQLFAAAAYQLSWSIYVSDYSRYLPRNVGVRASFLWTYFGALLGGAWMMLAGSTVAALSAGQNVAHGVETAGNMVFSGFGTVFLFSSLLGLATIASLNFYGASLTLLSIADSFRPIACTPNKRVASILSLAIVSCLIAWISPDDFMARLSDLLAILLYLFTPWTAINLVDFYFVRHAHYSVREIFNPFGMYGQWNWRGLLAYGVGFVAMIPFFSTNQYRGPVAVYLGGADIAMVIGLPISGLIYLWACRSMDLAADRDCAVRADLGLDA